MTLEASADVGSLARLLAPASIAVVGATDRPGSYGAETLLNLERIGFPGTVWGVNPRRDEVLGRPLRAQRRPTCPRRSTRSWSPSRRPAWPR